MATKYVWSGASGSNDGSSWTNAWTSLASAASSPAGDIIKVHKTHSQSLAASLTFTNIAIKSPISIICVDKDNGDALATGATITFTGGTALTGNLYIYGMKFVVGGSLGSFNFNASAAGRFLAENTTFASATSSNTGRIIPGSGNRSFVEWFNCHVDFSAAFHDQTYLDLQQAAEFTWRGGTYTAKSSNTQGAAIGYGITTATPRANIEGVEFNGTVGTVVILSAAGTQCGNTVLSRCKLPTYTSLFTTANATALRQQVSFWGCSSGTISVPNLGPTFYGYNGVLTPSLASYRTGGADDGEQANPYSWEMTTDGDAADFYSPLVSPPIMRWVDTGAQTITVYVASGTTLQDDELWVEVMSPSEAGSPTTQAVYRHTRPAPLAAPSNLSADGSTWNGSGVGTVQKIDVAIAPTVAGPVTVRLFFAKPSTTIFVDPKLEIA